MRQRIFGLEFEYSMAHHPAPGSAAVASQEVSELAVNLAHEHFRVGAGPNTSLFLANGGKLYYDIGHVEWATPECRTVREAVLYDKVGERLMDSIAGLTEKRLAENGRAGTLFVSKNNADAHRHTFGCHENYLVRRRTEAFEDPGAFLTYLIEQLVPFLVSRTILCGSGLVLGGEFHLSQRAGFINAVVSEDTQNERPIVNTRDEPHADPDSYRRLHLTLADANMAEWATFLKLGTTALVLDMIEDAFLDAPQLDDPVAALHAISRDPSLKATVRLIDGSEVTALDLQRHFLTAAYSYVGQNPDEETRIILEQWGEALDDLEHDPRALLGKLDWPTKIAYLEAANQGSFSWSDPRVQEIDARYHSVRPSDSVFHILRDADMIHTLLQPAEIEKAMTDPPRSTRARVRADALRSGAYVAEWADIQSNEGAHFEVADPFDWAPLEVLRAMNLSASNIRNWLQTGLYSPNPEVRAQALRGLGQLGLMDVTRVLQRLAQDAEPVVRAAAAEALGMVREVRAIEPLRQATTDRHHTVRFHAEMALRTLTAPGAGS